MWRKLFPILIVVGLFFSLNATTNQKSYSADRFDVDVAVQADGSLLVTETVVFDFVGGPFTFVFRELPVDHTDGITGIAASVDGRTLPGGTGPGQVEVTGSDPIRITWHIEPAFDTRHTFVLTYRVLGVVRQETGADALYWQALPDDYEYTIDSTTVTIAYPKEATLIAAPEVQAGKAGVETGKGQVVFTAQDLAPNAPLVVGLRFQAGSLIDAPPRWQARQGQRNALAPWWVGAAVALLGVGAAGLYLFVQPRWPKAAAPAGPIYSPPDDLPPAMAGAINNYTPSWSNALATIFDLAARDVLHIKEKPAKKWYESRDFVIQQVAQPAGLHPHERALLDLLFETRSGRTDRILVSELSRRVSSSRWKKYANSLEKELKATGFISAERKRTRLQLNILGFILLLSGLGGMIPIALLLLNSASGLWPLAVTLSLSLLGLVVLVVANSYKPLSDKGLAVAAQWQRFYEYLREVTRGRAAATRPDMFELYLPYTASYGLLYRWAKHFEKKGRTELPDWFHAVSTTGAGNMAVFVAMTAAASSSGGSAAGAGAAGAAGAGAAGGGASGAG